MELLKKKETNGLAIGAGIESQGKGLESSGTFDMRNYRSLVKITYKFNSLYIEKKEKPMQLSSTIDVT